MTLIELLVVIVLLTTLVTTAIPIISPGGEERKIREASRGINAYVQGAQARAIQTGRPFGVAFRRLSADTDRPEDNAVCAQLRYVEVPPAYSGLDSSSLARVCVAEGFGGVRQLALQLVRYGGETQQSQDRLPPGYDIELVPDGFFQAGDLVEIDGARYEILEPEGQFLGSQQARLRILPEHTTGSALAGYIQSLQEDPAGYCFWIKPVADMSIDLRTVYDWNGDELDSPETLASSDTQISYLSTAPAPYKIYRQPTLAGGEPLELPSGVAIDLQGSVFSNGVRVYKPELHFINSEFQLWPQDFVVLFSPEGSIHRVHGLINEQDLTLQGPAPVTGSLALLIGRRELIPAQPYGVDGAPTGADYAEPINLNDTRITSLPEADITEVTDQYNWLNLESQWLVIGGQSGSVTSIDNSAAYGGATTAEQLSAALENAPRRSVSGGR